MEDLVSIIVPAYNRGNRIINCLSSLVVQTYKNIEIIVVDDGSTDETCDIVNNFIINNSDNKKIYYFKQNNAGAPTARNFGFSRSQGNFIVFFDSDDLMLENRISKQVESIKKNNADCSACGFYYNSQNGNTYIPASLNNSPFESFIKRCIWGSTQSWMYKRYLVCKVNGYDESLNCFQDTDLNFRILSLQPNVTILPEPLSIFIEHSNDRITNSWENKGLLSIQKYHQKVIKFLVTNRRTDLLKDEIFIFSQDVALPYLKFGKYTNYIVEIKKLFELTKQLNNFHRLYYTSLLIIYSSTSAIKYLVKFNKQAT